MSDNGLKAMTPIAIERPGTIRLGVGTTAEVGRFARAIGARRALVVCDPFNARRVEALGLTCDAVVTGDVAAEPDDRLLARTVALADEFAPDLIVGFGGGSAMDLAKVVSVLHRSGLSAREVVGVERTPDRAVALVQVATTAGTGSEAGSRALITDSANHAKLAIQSHQMLADLAVLDPLMTVTVPQAVTAETGIDALAHCVESFTSVKAHPAVDLYAREGIRLVGAYLRRAVEDGSDLEARGGMALASLYGGYCLGPVNTTAGHAVAYPLSTRHGIPHGAANAVIFAHVLAFNAPAAPERTQEVLRLLGLGDAEDVFQAADGFCRDIGIETRLSRRGVPASDFPAMAREAGAIRRLLDNNPREVTEQDIRRIYEAAA